MFTQLDLACMDFVAVVARTRALHQDGKPVTDGSCDDPELTEEVYGRICSSKDSNPPDTLAIAPSRKSVFVFGPDSISSIILKQSAYDALRSLGFDHHYIYNDVCNHQHGPYYYDLTLSLTNHHNDGLSERELS